MGFFNVKNSTVDSSIPLPRLPLYDGFYHDTRPKGERKIINSSSWKPKNEGLHSFRFEIADKKDLILASNFFNYHFTNNNGLRKSLGATYEDMEQISYDTVSKALEKPVTWLVFDGIKLIAIALQTYYTFEEFANLFNGKLYLRNPKFVVKNDYAEDIKNGPYNLNANRIAILNNECIEQIGKYLPKDVENLAFGIVLGIHPKYMRIGLAEYINYEIIKDWKKFNCNYSFYLFTAHASYELSKKIGMKKLFHFPYGNYKENGKPVFENTSDGAKACHVMLANHKEISKRFEEREKSKI